MPDLYLFHGRSVYPNERVRAGVYRKGCDANRTGSPSSRDSRAIPRILDEDARVVRLAKSDPRAFAPLYARYFDPVYRYCYRRLGHPEVAADATAQVFTKALAALPGYRADATSFRSWLFAIAHNVITDDLRARRPVAPMTTAAHLVAPGPSPEEVVLTDETGGLVQALLGSLPAGQRPNPGTAASWAHWTRDCRRPRPKPRLRQDCPGTSVRPVAGAARSGSPQRQRRSASDER